MKRSNLTGRKSVMIKLFNVVGAGQTTFGVSKFERATITIRRARVDKAGNLRGQWPPGRVAHSREGRRRATTVTVTQNNNLMTAGGELRRVDGSVVSFGATVG